MTTEEGTEELEIEPEWCEDCMRQCEADNIEYTFDYYIEEGVAYCEHCNNML